MRVLVAAVGGAFAVAFVACGDGSSSGDSPTITPIRSPVEPTAVPTRPLPTPDSSANARRTGIAQVDAVIDAVLSGDAQAFEAVTKFVPMACTATPVGIGAFYCQEGEPDGTVTDVLPAAQCEGHFLRRGNFSLPGDTLTLYAVVRSEAGYGIVFSRLVGPSQANWGLRLVIEGGRIVSVNYGCGEAPADLAGGDLLLPPPEP